VYTAPTTWRISCGRAFPEDHMFDLRQTLTCNYCTFAAPLPAFDPATIKH
jgi:hypothetical protein